MSASDDHWRTAIAEVQHDDVLLRGYPLSELVGRVTYTDSVFLVLAGRLPTEAERQMLDAIFVSLVDHGISPSTMIVRTLASCGTPLQAAVAGGVLSIADWHGGSCEQVAAQLEAIVRSCRHLPATERLLALRLRARDAIEEARSRGVPIGGFGHPQHPGGDPRVCPLVGCAERLGVGGIHLQLVRLFEEELATIVGRPVPLNVTGATAALLLDLGLPARSVRGLVIAPRTAGLVAHAVEELEEGTRWRHAPAARVAYTGARGRHLDEPSPGSAHDAP